jgi:aquaporin Z
VIGAVSGGEVTYVARALAPGLLVLAMIYALGAVSGAHINPAVMLAFAVRGVFPWWRVPGYLLGQFAGGILAAFVLRALFGLVKDLGATLPRYGSGTALVMEVILTCLLVTVILNVATPHRLVGHNAALAVGCTVALCHLFAGPISGPSMNPARSLGPALIAGNLRDVWIYFIGPVAGGLLAVAGVWVLHGAPNEDEIKAANNP